MKDFSIVLPTRGNPVDVKKLLDSFERTTRRKDRLEVLFAIDEGKTEIVGYVESLRYSFDIRFYERPPTDNFSDDYYNWLANRSAGQNVWAFNDDAWMQTQNWDEKVREAIKKSGWSVYLAQIKDTAQIRKGHYWACFPMFPRKAINTKGYMFHPKVRMYPADKVAYDIYVQLGRIINVDDVLIIHDHIEEADPSKSRMMRIFMEDRDAGNLAVNAEREFRDLMKAAMDDPGPKPKSKLTQIMEIVRGKNGD